MLFALTVLLMVFYYISKKKSIFLAKNYVKNLEIIRKKLYNNLQTDKYVPKG